MLKTYQDKYAMLLILLMLGNISSCINASACGPSYDKAVFVSWIHPDLPLRSYAAGNLGVIQSGWAKSYLCVAYRYLANRGLNKIEQASMERIWIERLSSETSEVDTNQGEPVQDYIELRNKVLGIKAGEVWSEYSKISPFISDNQIGQNSFVEALQTLKARIKRYGQSSKEVHQWLTGQDCIFGQNASGKLTVPPLLKGGFDKTLTEDRLYQRAAAMFYLKEYARAADLFEKIARDSQSPRHGLASYMVARCRVNDVLNNGSEKTDLIIAAIENQAKNEADFEQKEDLLDLVCLLKCALETNGGNFARLSQSVMGKANDKTAAQCFGRNISDLTDILSSQDYAFPGGEAKSYAGSKVLKNDLSAWVATVNDGYEPFYFSEERLAALKRQNPDQSQWYVEDEKRLAARKLLQKRRGNFALQQWRQGHQLPWLVAVMLCGGLRGSERSDALEAAKKLTPQSPAFQTASFYVVDALISQGKLDQARMRLKATLITAGKSILPSSANLFKSEQMALATDTSQYLSAACMKLSTPSSNCLLMPDNWLKYERRNTAGPTLGGLDEEVARDLDYNLPFSLWLKLAHKKDIPSNLHARIVCAAWLRSILLGQSRYTGQLSQDLAQAYPQCAPALSKYTIAAPGRDKQFALAQLILDNYGMAPYVGGGLPRFAMPINQFNYYQLNFWLPSKEAGPDLDLDDYYRGTIDRGNSQNARLMLGFYKPGISRLLTEGEKNEARKERAQIEKCHPSILLGQAVLDQAKAGSNDPDMAHLLYKIVKLPLWSGPSATGTTYSKAALKVLKQRYRSDKWASRVRYAD